MKKKCGPTLCGVWVVWCWETVCFCHPYSHTLFKYFITYTDFLLHYALHPSYGSTVVHMDPCWMHTGSYGGSAWTRGLDSFRKSYCLPDILTLEEFSDQSILVLSECIHGLVIDHPFFAHAPHHTATQTLKKSCGHGDFCGLTFLKAPYTPKSRYQ